MSINLKLISPISAKCDAPYENPWDCGEDYSIMTEIEKMKCQKEISKAVCRLIMPKNSRRGLMKDFDRKTELEKKVFSAVPSVEENKGRQGQRNPKKQQSSDKEIRENLCVYMVHQGLGN